MSISFLFFTFYINFTSSSHIIYQQQSLLLILMRWTYIEWEDENVKKYERKKIKHFGINSNKDLCWSIWHRWREFELFSFIKITFMRGVPIFPDDWIWNFFFLCFSKHSLTHHIHTQAGTADVADWEYELRKAKKYDYEPYRIVSHRIVA